MLRARFRPLQKPDSLVQQLPLGDSIKQFVDSSRQTIRSILNGEDERLLVVMGPCSIHDPEAAMDYAQRAKKLMDQYGDQLFIVMRVYNEKPRTKLGWKGYIYDPRLDGSNRVQKGLYDARSLLLQINELGVPTATEFVDLAVPQYISDLISYACVGARTSESPLHRSLASGLPMPVGFKNNTAGNIQAAVDGASTARHSQLHLGIDSVGKATMCETEGNADCHVILRGGDMGANHDAASIDHTKALMNQAGLTSGLLVDCSHGNGDNVQGWQQGVVKELCRQFEQTAGPLRGVMLESNIIGGNQRLDQEQPLIYGQSITDPCMSWEDTEWSVGQIAEAVAQWQKQAVKA